MFKRIDHVGVAVEDLDAALALYNGIFGMAIQHREVVEEQGVEAVLVEIGKAHIELMRPLDADTPVGRFIEKRGAGMHHVAYKVDDLPATLDNLRAAGIELIDETPRRGILDSKVAFIQLASTGGVLTELVEASSH